MDKENRAERDGQRDQDRSGWTKRKTQALQEKEIELSKKNRKDRDGVKEYD